MYNEKKDPITLGCEPNYNSGRQVLAKGALGIGVGLVVGFLLFIILYMVQGKLGIGGTNNVTSAGAQSTVNPLLPLILIIIAFIATFIGNVMLAGIFNLFYPTKYYDLGKMFSNGLLSNVIVFFVFMPLYLLFYNDIQSLFTILAIHILFSIFTSYTHIEFLTNPNYGSSHLIGTTIGVSVAALLFLIMWKATSTPASVTQAAKGQSQFLILLPSVLGYCLIPFFHALREKIYYQFYENGNEFLYLPTLQEISQQESLTQQDVTDDDIPVDLR